MQVHKDKFRALRKVTNDRAKMAKPIVILAITFSCIFPQLPKQADLPDPGKPISTH
jgi:hypothetical protein